MNNYGPCISMDSTLIQLEQNTDHQSFPKKQF